MKRACRLLNEDTKENSRMNYSKKKAFFTRKRQGDSNVSEANSVIGLVTHHVLLTNIGKNDWIVDSGATCKM